MPDNKAWSDEEKQKFINGLSEKPNYWSNLKNALGVSQVPLEQKEVPMLAHPQPIPTNLPTDGDHEELEPQTDETGKLIGVKRKWKALNG